LMASWLLFVMWMVSSEAFRFRSDLSVQDMFDPAVGDRLGGELKNRDRSPTPVLLRETDAKPAASYSFKTARL